MKNPRKPSACSQQCPSSASGRIIPATARLALLGMLLLASNAQAGLFDSVIDAAKGKVSAEKATAYNFSSDPKDHSAQYVEPVRISNIKDVKKLGIVNFTVEFSLYKEASATGGSSYMGRTRSITRTKEIPPPDMGELQAMTDRLYEKVQNDFNAMGIEIVPFETLKATKNYAELRPAQHESPWFTEMQDSVSVFIAPSGMPLYMDNPERASALKKIGFSFGTNTRMKEVMMTYDLKQEVHLLSVNMVVDFATMKSSGSSFSAFGANVSAADVHHLHANNTSYRFISMTQPELLYVKLKQPIVSEKSLWSAVSQTTEKEGSSDMTSSSVETSTSSEGVFDSATYYERSEAMLNAARQMFALELAKKR